MTTTPTPESDRFDRIEERLERLERAITQALEDSERSRQELRDEG